MKDDRLSSADEARTPDAESAAPIPDDELDAAGGRYPERRKYTSICPKCHKRFAITAADIVSSTVLCPFCRRGL